MSIITSHAFKGQTLVDRVKFWSEAYPDTPAFIFGGPKNTDRRLLTNRDVLDLSSRFAYRLTALGIKPGDIICIALPNSPERVVAEFGVHLAGAVPMNGQVLRADGEDLFETLLTANCSCIILDPDQMMGAWEICKTAFYRYNIYENHAEIESNMIPSLTKVSFCRVLKNGFLKNLDGEKLIYEGRTAKDTCIIFTTSGSTGYSKLIPQTHKATLTMDYSFLQMNGLQQGTKYLSPSPLGWSGGFPYFYLYFGWTHVLLDESHGEVPNKYAFIWEFVCRENIKYAYLLPAVMNALNKERRINQEQVSHRFSRILLSSQPITKDTMSVIGELTDIVTVEYTGTEFGLVSRINIDSTTRQQFQDYMAGYLVAGNRLKIVDDELKTVPLGSRGEILLQSHSISSGYIGADARSTENFLPDGWYRTEDTGFLREDGCLFVEGRTSDAIMHGAYIFFPPWLEKKLINCPGVKDVAIVPVPDKVLHHEICACVHLDDTADVNPMAEDIIYFCQSEMLLDKSSSLSVVPKYVIFCTEFPETNTDKLNRKELAKIAKERLNL